MDSELKKILLEIEKIIAKIGNHDSGKTKTSVQAKKELKAIFNKKINLAKSIKKKLQAVA